MEDRTQRLRDLEAELSPRHLNFARLVAEGELSLTDAYGQVYPNAQRSTCLTNGSRLLGNARISEYIELLTGEAADTFVVNRTQVMQKLWDVAERYGDDPKAANAVASALKTLLDHLVPKAVKAKVELTGKDGGPVQTKNEGGLSDAMTRAIMVQTLGLSDAQADRLLGERSEPDADATEGR